ARALYQLGDVLAVQLRLVEAETMHRETLAMYRKLNGNEDLMVAKVLYELAMYLALQNTKLLEAETMNREALAIQHKLLGKEHPDVTMSIDQLARVLQQQGKLAEAETLCREELASAMALFKRSATNDSKRSDFAMSLAFCQGGLSGVLAKVGQSDQAEQLM